MGNGAPRSLSPDGQKARHGARDRLGSDRRGAERGGTDAHSAPACAAERRTAGGLTASPAGIGLDEPREALRHLLEKKVLIALGRRQRLGAFGPRHPERREVVSVHEQGRTSVERLPSRRY
jgi:hypothetical protein